MNRVMHLSARGMRLGLLVCLVRLVSPGELDAQERIELVPFVGLYLPLADAIVEPGGSLKQQLGPVLGARGFFWLGPRLSLEAVVGLGIAEVIGRASSTSVKSSGRTLLVSTRGRWRLGEPGTAWPVFLSGGLGVVAHGGDAYRPLRGTTDAGLVLGAGTEWSIRDGLRLRFDLEDNVYVARFGFGGEESGSRLQNDILLSVGLTFTVPGGSSRDSLAAARARRSLQCSTSTTSRAGSCSSITR